MKNHTPTSIAALAERALAVAGLPLESVFLTVSLQAGEVSGIGIIGRPRYTLEQAMTLAGAFGDPSPHPALTADPMLNCVIPGVTVQIHHTAEPVPA